jgi:Phosphotransferase enzyme family
VDARDQLGRRLEVSHLDWGLVDADPRAVRLWEGRPGHYEALSELPMVRSHGDYSLGNLVSRAADVVALDWATFGWEPLGFDSAHLALSSGQHPRSAYRASTSQWTEDRVATGFAAAVAVIGSNRVHWMLSAGVEVPDWYVDFLWEYRPK